jgi:predicted nucleic acid-binding protein
MPQRYFFDTSALVGRYLVGAPGHAWVQALCDPAQPNLIGIVEITAAELAATYNQLVRGGTLRRIVCDRALTLFWRQIDAGAYNIVPVTSALVRRAADRCGVNSLKGYDAVQLAAALVHHEDARAFDASPAAAGAPALGGPIFLTEDIRLAAAATAEGFTIDNPVARP